jgi:hypothetical protein
MRLESGLRISLQLGPTKYNERNMHNRPHPTYTKGSSDNIEKD